MVLELEYEQVKSYREISQGFTEETRILPGNIMLMCLQGCGITLR